MIEIASSLRAYISQKNNLMVLLIRVESWGGEKKKVESYLRESYLDDFM